jgi:hypothetical protein
MTDSWPDGMTMVRQLRDTLGLFSGAMPVSPKQAWEEALARVRGLTEGRCWKCMESEEKADSVWCEPCMELSTATMRPCPEHD